MSQSKAKEAPSLKKVDSNRHNARRSTGPKTPEGKQASCMNALKHGMLARELVITGGSGGENAAEFSAMYEQLREELEPVGLIEEMLVEQVAVSYWRMRRVIRSENGRIRNEIRNRETWAEACGAKYDPQQADALTAERALPGAENGNHIIRYAAAVERALYRALRQLDQRQTMRMNRKLAEDNAEEIRKLSIEIAKRDAIAENDAAGDLSMPERSQAGEIFEPGLFASRDRSQLNTRNYRTNPDSRLESTPAPTFSQP
jgi:hypothetical protein